MNEWINVKDRLPNREQKVLCCSRQGDLFIGKYLDAEYVKGIAAFIDAVKDYARGTTHWMPLPEPPKEDK